MKSIEYIWFKVTRDKFELPVAIADSADELAKMTGTTKNSIYSAMSHAKKNNKKCVYQRIIIEREENG